MWNKLMIDVIFVHIIHLPLLFIALSAAQLEMKFRPCIDIHQGIVKQIVGSTLVDAPAATAAISETIKSREEKSSQKSDNKESKEHSGKATDAATAVEGVTASVSEASAIKTNFATDKPASEFARMYKEDGLYGGHVIMLGPGCEAAAKGALKEFPGGFHVGGGINPKNAKDYLDAGASHVIVTSYVFHDGKIDFDRLNEIVKVVSKEKLILDLSCRRRIVKKQDDDKEQSDSKKIKGSSDDIDESEIKYYVVTDRWQKFTDFEITKENLELLSNYCAEFLVHGVDVEGMRVGIIEDLVKKLGEWSPIPVTYAGGARSLDDFNLVRELGKGKVDLTVGSALDIFGGDLAYADVVKWHNKEQENGKEN